MPLPIVDRTAFVALGLLALQVALGAVIVKLALPPLRVVLHLALAMLILATLIVAARGGLARRPHARALVASGLGFAAVLLGALTANTGAASACLGFPLCNGQVVPDGNYLLQIHWRHRLLAYTLLGRRVRRVRQGVAGHSDRRLGRIDGCRLNRSLQRRPGLIQDLDRQVGAVPGRELHGGRVDDDLTRRARQRRRRVLLAGAGDDHRRPCAQPHRNT